jgi:hypothetical protein
MNVVFENVSSAAVIYPIEEITTVLHGGRRYSLVGESLGEELSSKERFCHVIIIIGFAVAAFFTCGLALCALAFKGFRHGMSDRFRELWAGRQINLHYTPNAPTQWQTNLTTRFINALQSSIHDNREIPEQLHAVSLCISIQFNHGEQDPDDLSIINRPRVKKQFLFKNEDRSPITQAGLIQKIGSIHDQLLTSIRTEIDVATTRLNIGCVLLHQERPRDLVKAYYLSTTMSDMGGYDIPTISRTSDGVINILLSRVNVVRPIEVISLNHTQLIEGPDYIASP